MKLALVLTNDWELYGDGSGDFFEVQYRPLESLLTALNGHGARLTIMAEVAQQWAHQALAANESWARDISEAWESLLKTAASQGHDVQLHLHPQWLEAQYSGGTWILDMDRWALSSLPEDRIREALVRGRAYLEGLLRDTVADYECFAFRAGAYCLEPSRTVIAALRDAGFRCDTSVTRGLRNPGLFDYRAAHSNVAPWPVSADSIMRCDEDGSGLVEFPIHSQLLWDSPVLRKKAGIHYGWRVPREEQLWCTRSDRMNQSRYPRRRRPNQKGSLRRLTFSNLIRIWLRRHAVQLDYDILPASVFVAMLTRAFRQQRRERSGMDDPVLPVIASGHVKNMPDTSNIRTILDGVRRVFGENLVFWTLSDAERYWRRQLPKEAHL